MYLNDSATAPKKLHGVYAKVEATATISASGAMQTCVLPAGVDGDRVAAVSAPMLNRGNEMLLETTGGEMQQVFIKARHGCVLLNTLGVDASSTLIVCSCDKCREMAEIPDCINAMLNDSLASLLTANAATAING